MHFKNDNDIKSNTHHAPTTSTPSTTSTSSSTSSTDSGVIIIDNRTTFGRKINSDNQKNITKNNNGSIKKNTNFNRSGENDISIDKIETPTKVDNSKWNEKLNNPSNFSNSNIKCNGSNDCSYNNKISADRNDGCNVAVRNINIENVINISNGHESADMPTNPENHLKHQNCNPVNSSPTVSIRSTSISIVSIDENAIDSSVIDSDSDREADAEGVHTNYVVKKLGQQTTYPAGSPNVPNINKGLTVISQKITPENIVAKDVLSGSFLPPRIPCEPVSPTTPQIGSIALTNSTDVTFGDKHFYEGPVTIQQILIDRRDKRKAGEEDGLDNPTFESETGCDNSGTKGSSPLSATGSPFSCIRRRKAIVITAIIVVIAISIGVVFLKMKSPKSKDNIGGGLILRIVARDGWLAQPPSKPLVPLDLPVPSVIVLATQTDICSTQAMCTFRVRYIQTYNIESQQNDDIIYNFLIGGDGNVYEGRGWNLQGAHMKGYNNATISFAYIGTFKHQKPNDKQMGVTKLLLEEGVRLEKLSKDYKIYPANKFNPTSIFTASDTALYESFTSWPHWSDA